MTTITYTYDELKVLEQEPCYNPDEWCKTCKEYDQDKHCCHRWSKVIRNAVEEIKQTCEDAISRQATIDTLWIERKKLDSCMQKCLENNQMSLRAFIKAERNRIEEDIYIIKNLPPVTPQPKMGHWIEVEKYSDGKHKIKCSECRSHIIDRGHANSYVVKEKYKYCPRCGAKMVEPQESEGKE